MKKLVVLKETKEFVETPQFKQLNIGFIVDEGHASGNKKLLDIKVAERKPIQVLVTSTGSISAWVTFGMPQCNT